MSINPVWLPPVGPLVAARTYLLDQLAARNNPLPVDVEPPGGTPTSYALLSSPGSDTRVFLADYTIRVRVFNNDAVQLEDDGILLHRLLMHAVHQKITVPGKGAVTISAAKHQYGPADLDDPDVPMLGKQAAVIWTIGLKPEK